MCWGLCNFKIQIYHAKAVLVWVFEDVLIMDYSDDKLLNELIEIEKENEYFQSYNKYMEVWKRYIKIDENINLLFPAEL